MDHRCRQPFRSRELSHHGIIGQRWGVRRTPEELGYTRTTNNDTIKKENVIGRNVKFKFAQMPIDEYLEACRLWDEFDEIDISRGEKEYVYEELDNNLSDLKRQRCIVDSEIGNYKYTAINKGHNQYKIINRELIDKPKDLFDEIFTEVVGSDWRKYDDGK